MKYNTQTQHGIKNLAQKFIHGLCKRHVYFITSPIRVLPDFFIIGVVRSGTTSLYHYLGQHPSIKNAAYDELGYFDDNYHLGIHTEFHLVLNHGGISLLSYDTGVSYPVVHLG